MSNHDQGSGRGRTISREEARDRIYDFLAREGCRHSKETVVRKLEYTGVTQHPNLGDLFMFESPYGEFWLSAARGNLVTFNAPPRLKVDEAGEMIREFLGRHVPEFGRRNFRQTDSYMEEPYWKEEYLEKPGRGEHSIFQNWISVAIDVESGQIHNFNYSDLRHIRYVPPKIGEEEARKAVMERYPEGEILELELMEHTSDGGVTWVTMWNALIRPSQDEDATNRIISIDADTGGDIPL